MIKKPNHEFDFDMDLPGIDIPEEKIEEPVTEMNFSKIAPKEILNHSTDLEIVRACGNCVYFVPTKQKVRLGSCTVTKPTKSTSKARTAEVREIYPMRDATMHCRLHKLKMVGINSVVHISDMTKIRFNTSGDLKCKKQ